MAPNGVTFESRDRIRYGELTSDHHANPVSAISALTATFHFLPGLRDSPTQTCRSRGACERQPSLWEHCLSPRPGQLGSIQSLNGRRAGDRRSLAV